MQKRKIKIFTVLFILPFLISTSTYSQNQDSLYRFNLDMSFGYGLHFTDLNFEGLTTEQGIFSFRFMWQPEHILRIGIESGYLPLYSLETKVFDTIFGSTDVFLTLQSIPIMFVSATEVAKNFEVIAGIGGVILISEVNSFGNNVRSTMWSNAFELGTSYLFPIGERFKVGAELKSFYLYRLENFYISLQLTAKYDFYSY